MIEYKIDLDAAEDAVLLTPEQEILAALPKRYIGPVTGRDRGPVLQVIELQGFKIGEEVINSVGIRTTIAYFAEDMDVGLVIVNSDNQFSRLATCSKISPAA